MAGEESIMGADLRLINTRTLNRFWALSSLLRFRVRDVFAISWGDHQELSTVEDCEFNVKAMLEISRKSTVCFVSER